MQKVNGEIIGLWKLWANQRKVVFSLYPIRPVGWIFCSPEQSKLCFEALETRFVPQNHLLRRLSESIKTPSEVGVYDNINGFRYGKQQKKPNKQRWAKA